MKGNPAFKGRDFEKICFEYLKTIYDGVKWLSYESGLSIYDFECKKDGIIFMVEAKFKGGKTKPCLRYNQRNADFVITNKGKEFEMIPKEDFNEKVYITEPKSIFRVNKDLLKVIDSYKLGNESREETVWRLFWQLGLDIPEERYIVFDMKYIIADEYVKLRGNKLREWEVMKGTLPEYALKLNNGVRKR